MAFLAIFQTEFGKKPDFFRKTLNLYKITPSDAEETLSRYVGFF